MPLIDDPAWPAYKAALSRLAKAGASLDEVDPTTLADAALEDFLGARAEFEAARARLVGAPCPTEGPALEGAMLVDGYGAHPRALWLGQSEIGLQAAAPETPEE